MNTQIAYRIGYLMCSIWFNFLMSHDTLIVLDTVSHNISWYNTIDRIYEVIWCCSIKCFSCQSILRSSRQIAGLFTNLFQRFILKFHAFFFLSENMFFLLIKHSHANALLSPLFFYFPFLFSPFSLLYSVLFHFVFYMKEGIDLFYCKMMKESGSQDSLELMVDANGLEGTYVLHCFILLLWWCVYYLDYYYTSSCWRWYYMRLIYLYYIFHIVI